MKWTLLIVLAFFSFNLNAASSEISGVVTLSKDLEKTVTPKGALFIIARKAGASGGMPMAVLRIAEPKFPQNFTLGEQNLMMGGKFEGPMSITARYAPSGDAMDKSGPEGTDPKAKTVEPGKKDLKIELKAKK